MTPPTTVLQKMNNRMFPERLWVGSMVGEATNPCDAVVGKSQIQGILGCPWYLVNGL